MKRLVWFISILFLCLNIVSIFQAYRFTHFDENSNIVRKPLKDLSLSEKLDAVFFGVKIPKPKNEKKTDNYQTIILQSNKKIECWYRKKDSAKATVVIFHGYGSSKTGMLDKAAIFDSLNYNTLLVDFMGSGGSEGNNCTIGFKEAKQVETAYNFIKKEGEKNIYLFGTSMGAVAIMKAIKDAQLNPKGIIIECPFGTMFQTVENRFENMNIPSFPMVNLLVFWGGIENGFWAFNHNPEEYAKNIKCPTLLLYGEKDKNVSRSEINAIYTQLKGKKTLKTFKNAGHQNYLNKYKTDWINSVNLFLK